MLGLLDKIDDNIVPLQCLGRLALVAARRSNLLVDALEQLNDVLLPVQDKAGLLGLLGALDDGVSLLLFASHADNLGVGLSVQPDTGLLVPSEQGAEVAPVLPRLHQSQDFSKGLLGVRDVLEAVDGGELVLKAIELDNHGVLLDVVSHLWVKDELALLLGQVGGEDNLVLDRVKGLVQLCVFGLGKDSAEA